MSEIDKNQYLENSRGHLIPLNLVREVDKLRDSLVMEIVVRSKNLNTILTDFKTEAMNDILAFVQLSAEKYGVKMGGEKGNIQLTSFDGKYKVSRSINEYIVFDERLQVAKTLIDECIKEWSADSRSEMRVLINSAFEVDKTGRINTERVLGLRRLDITHPKWITAMEAISDSVMVTGSKAYIRIYERKDNGQYEQINLDLAAI